MAKTPSHFIPFGENIPQEELPLQFTLLNRKHPHPLCVKAIADLQAYLQTQKDFIHPFGLDEKETANSIGKMFGVLVVQSQAGEIGYLAAFSGKLGGTNTHVKFVPPVYDLLAEQGFLEPGMKKLGEINENINQLSLDQPSGFEEQINCLKQDRKKHSNALQRRIFEHYHFLNRAGISKGLYELFTLPDYQNPPAGAGECSGPKLLQYAFLHQLKPLALAEFWWGQSPKSATWKHGHFYDCCKEKCEPILAHMLSGINPQKGLPSLKKKGHYF
jgi:tRNA pseudouridine32 synthase / 23S rRNA pseudouridine746 synthase